MTLTRLIHHTWKSLLLPFCVKSWNHRHVSLQCLYSGLTNCRLFTASCLVALVFLWDLPLSTMPPSYVKLRETWREILTQGTACQTESLCQEEQVSYVPEFQKQTDTRREAGPSWKGDRYWNKAKLRVFHYTAPRLISSTSSVTYKNVYFTKSQ